MGPECKFIDSGSSNKVEGGNKGDILVLGVPLGTPILLRGAIRVLGPGFGASHLTGGGHLIDQPEVIEKIFTHLRVWPSFSHAPPSSAVALFFTFFNHLAASVRNRAAVGVANYEKAVSLICTIPIISYDWPSKANQGKRVELKPVPPKDWRRLRLRARKAGNVRRPKSLKSFSAISLLTFLRLGLHCRAVQKQMVLAWPLRF